MIDVQIMEPELSSVDRCGLRMMLVTIERRLRSDRRLLTPKSLVRHAGTDNFSIDVATRLVGVVTTLMIESEVLIDSNCTLTKH